MPRNRISTWTMPDDTTAEHAIELSWANTGDLGAGATVCLQHRKYVHGSGSGGSGEVVVSWDLDDRRTVNQLIRDLRRARDQRFGADA